MHFREPADDALELLAVPVLAAALPLLLLLLPQAASGTAHTAARISPRAGLDRLVALDLITNVLLSGEFVPPNLLWAAKSASPAKSATPLTAPGRAASSTGSESRCGQTNALCTLRKLPYP